MQTTRLHRTLFALVAVTAPVSLFAQAPARAASSAVPAAMSTIREADLKRDLFAFAPAFFAAGARDAQRGTSARQQRTHRVHSGSGVDGTSHRAASTPEHFARPQDSALRRFNLRRRSRRNFPESRLHRIEARNRGVERTPNLAIARRIQYMHQCTDTSPRRRPPTDIHASQAENVVPESAQ